MRTGKSLKAAREMISVLLNELAFSESLKSYLKIKASVESQTNKESGKMQGNNHV